MHPLLLPALLFAAFIYVRSRSTVELGGPGMIENTGGLRRPRTWTISTWPPPGLSPVALLPGAKASAIPLIRAAALAENLGASFVAAMEGLAIHDGDGARMHMPAWAYDNRPWQQRPLVNADGDPKDPKARRERVSAFGPFQFQDALAQRLFGVQKASEMDWAQQTAGCVGVYAAKVRAAPSDDFRWALLWHVSPSAYKRAVAVGSFGFYGARSARYERAVGVYVGEARARGAVA